MRGEKNEEEEKKEEQERICSIDLNGLLGGRPIPIGLKVSKDRSLKKMSPRKKKEKNCDQVKTIDAAGEKKDKHQIRKLEWSFQVSHLGYFQHSKHLFSCK